MEQNPKTTALDLLSAAYLADNVFTAPFAFSPDSLSRLPGG